MSAKRESHARAASSPQIRVGRHARRAWIKSTVLWTVALIAVYVWFHTSSPKPRTHPVRCVVVGLDGLDPKLTKQWMDKGILPNLRKLAGDGDFTTLATANPPQS